MPETLASTPILEQIIADITTALADVTIAGGYHYDLDTERPLPAGGNNMEGGKAVVVLGQVTPADTVFGYDTWNQRVLVRYTVQNTTETTSIDVKMIVVGMDIAHRLCKDKASRQRSSLAINTQFIGITPFPREKNANEATADAEFEVMYRTAFGKPYSAS